MHILYIFSVLGFRGNRKVPPKHLLLQPMFYAVRCHSGEALWLVSPHHCLLFTIALCSIFQKKKPLDALANTSNGFW